MNHPAVYLLRYLEGIDQKNKAWQQYIALRSGEVQQFIDRLLAFSGLNVHSRPGVIVNQTAYRLQRRLNKILEV